MKLFFIPIIICAAIGIPTIFGIVPVVLGVPVMIGSVLLVNFILGWMSRGLPYEIIKIRISGGVIMMIFKRSQQVIAKRFMPVAGVIATLKHGLYTLMPEGIRMIDGVPFLFAPEKSNYNIDMLDHILTINELKKRGINNIEEIADTDPLTHKVLGLKDDPRIADIKAKFDVKTPDVINLEGMDNFYRYTKEASNPAHQDMYTKLGISQGLIGARGGGSTKWIILAFILGAVVAGVLAFIFTGRGGAQIIIENTSHIIPM